jgi:hypothetical protein
MLDFQRVTAIAVIGDAAVRPVAVRHQSAAAVAAVTSRFEDGSFSFALRTHVVRRADALQHWVDAVVADDPVLVGHRLLRISRLLRAAGLDRSLGHSFNPAGRHDIADLHGRRMIPLVVSALHADVLAIDETALAWRPGVRRDGTMLASAALINALATWVVFVRRTIAGPDHAVTRERLLTRLAHDLRRGGAPPALVASLEPNFH